MEGMRDTKPEITFGDSPVEKKHRTKSIGGTSSYSRSKRELSRNKANSEVYTLIKEELDFRVKAGETVAEYSLIETGPKDAPVTIMVLTGNKIRMWYAIGDLTKTNRFSQEIESFLNDLNDLNKDTWLATDIVAEYNLPEKDRLGIGLDIKGALEHRGIEAECGGATTVIAFDEFGVTKEDIGWRLYNLVLNRLLELENTPDIISLEDIGNQRFTTTGEFSPKVIDHGDILLERDFSLKTIGVDNRGNSRWEDDVITIGEVSGYFTGVPETIRDDDNRDRDEDVVFPAIVLNDFNTGRPVTEAVLSLVATATTLTVGDIWIYAALGRLAHEDVGLYNYFKDNGDKDRVPVNFGGPKGNISKKAEQMVNMFERDLLIGIDTNPAIFKDAHTQELIAAANGDVDAQNNIIDTLVEMTDGHFSSKFPGNNIFVDDVKRNPMGIMHTKDGDMPYSRFTPPMIIANAKDKNAGIDEAQYLVQTAVDIGDVLDTIDLMGLGGSLVSESTLAWFTGDFISALIKAFKASGLSTEIADMKPLNARRRHTKGTGKFADAANRGDTLAKKTGRRRGRRDSRRSI